MFTDIVGYTALAQKNESLALSLLEKHRELLRRVIARHGGREVKTIGDAFLIEFTSALEATECAVEIQKVLGEYNRDAPEKIHVRIGVHVGDVVHEQNDILGDAVNIASRIVPLAEGGGICISDQVFSQVRNKVLANFQKLESRKLKNVDVSVEIYRLQLEPPHTPPSYTGGAAKDVSYPLRQLALYHSHKCASFNRENWPYDIDERTFVENFDYLIGTISTSSVNSDKTEDCLSFIQESISDGPVICAGYYGMGKTVISKMLFKKWDSSQTSIHPVYVSLSHKRLKDFYEKELGKQIAKEVKSQVKSQVFGPHPKEDSGESAQLFDEESFDDDIYGMIENRKILLIFDGIDESANEREELRSFLDFIFKNNLLALLTCRLEYRPFFDLCQDLGGAMKFHKYVELREWERPQWNSYVNSLVRIYPQKLELISSFSKKLERGFYSTLPRRPLFLKMLTDLEINNQTGISILPELSSNLAETYFKFIKWKVRDDYVRKGGSSFGFDLNVFQNECFELLREIALLEYDSALKNKESQVTLNSIRKICADKKFVELSEHYVSQILLKSSLFAILTRTDGETFIFSHKSFMEYLVAYSLARCLFPEDMSPTSSSCDAIWQCFQTHEVSQHFVNEVERVQVTLNLSPERRTEFILNAFQRVVDEQFRGSLIEYDERFQEILYYIGRLKMSSPALVTILQHIVTNKDQYNPVYFRSASLALSRIMGNEYCEKYALHLIEDMNDKKRDFTLNQDIQKRYYGEATLRRILKEDIDEYISGGNSSSIISLKILTYFTAIPIPDKDRGLMSQYLDQVKEAALKQAHTNIRTICEEVHKVLSSQKSSG